MSLCLKFQSFFCAVSKEAARIRLGEIFVSFAEFDRCLQSWGVLNGRASHRYATRSDRAIRVCRFGKTVRRHCKDLTTDPTVNTSPPPVGTNTDQLQDQENSQSHRLDQQNSQSHRLRPLPAGRNPLAPLDVNQVDGIILSNTVRSSTIPGMQAPRSFVQHTSEWLPPHNPSKNGTTLLPLFLTMQSCSRCPFYSSAFHVPLAFHYDHIIACYLYLPPLTFLNQPGRKVPKQGACGELSRFLPESSAGSPEPIPCPFRVRATLHKRTGVISITICELRHNCPLYKHKWRAAANDSFWLAVTLANRVVQNVKVLVSALLTIPCR